MKTRIVHVSSEKHEWYEVQVKVLGFLWIDANIYRSTFPQIFSTLEDAMNSLYKLKKPVYKKKVVANIDL